MTTDGLLAVLQLADGLFPAGGFAHSFGLETYVQSGVVRDRQGLEAFLRAQLAGSAGPTDAVAAACASRFAAQGDLDGWLDLDRRLDTTRFVPEFRQASLQMARQTLRVGLVQPPAVPYPPAPWGVPRMLTGSRWRRGTMRQCSELFSAIGASTRRWWQLRTCTRRPCWS